MSEQNDVEKNSDKFDGVKAVISGFAHRLISKGDFP